MDKEQSLTWCVGWQAGKVVVRPVTQDSFQMVLPEEMLQKGGWGEVRVGGEGSRSCKRRSKAMGTGAGQARGAREDADGGLSAGCQVSARKALVPALSRKCDTCLLYNKIRTL